MNNFTASPWKAGIKDRQLDTVAAWQQLPGASDNSSVIPSFISIVADCLLMCQNRGTLNKLTCTCDCADGYSGDDCSCKFTVCIILLCITTSG